MYNRQYSIQFNLCHNYTHMMNSKLKFRVPKEDEKILYGRISTAKECGSDTCALVDITYGNSWLKDWSVITVLNHSLTPPPHPPTPRGPLDPKPPEKSTAVKYQNPTT
jgi:hypothetical protein